MQKQTSKQKKSTKQKNKNPKQQQNKSKTKPSNRHALLLTMQKKKKKSTNQTKPLKFRLESIPCSSLVFPFRTHCFSPLHQTWNHFCHDSCTEPFAAQGAQFSVTSALPPHSPDLFQRYSWSRAVGGAPCHLLCETTCISSSDRIF